MIIGGNKQLTQTDGGAFNILAGSFILELLTKKPAVLLFPLLSEESHLNQLRLWEYFFFFFFLEIQQFILSNLLPRVVFGLDQ